MNNDLTRLSGEKVGPCRVDFYKSWRNRSSVNIIAPEGDALSRFHCREAASVGSTFQLLSRCCAKTKYFSDQLLESLRLANFPFLFAYPSDSRES